MAGDAGKCDDSNFYYFSVIGHFASKFCLALSSLLTIPVAGAEWRRLGLLCSIYLSNSDWIC